MFFVSSTSPRASFSALQPPLRVQEPPAPSQWDPLGAAGRARVGSSAHELWKVGALLTRMCSMTSKPSGPALLSALLSSCSKDSAPFLGHRHCPAPLFGLGTPTSSSILTTEWQPLLLKSDILQRLGGADMHTPMAWPASPGFSQ